METSEYLTVSEALERILANIEVLPDSNVPLMKSHHRILAENVIAKEDLPPFSNSAMDGYAVLAEDLITASKENPVTLDIVDDIAAGTVSNKILLRGKAARITTGAPLPEGATAVVPVEETSEQWRSSKRRLPSSVDIFTQIDNGAHIRKAGEDVEAGSAVIPKGKLIRSQEIALLASLGFDLVKVIRQPKVGILSTGDELIPISEALTPGKIRNSNGYTQSAQVLALDAVPVDLGVAKDTAEDVRKKLEVGLEIGVDLFISSAGVSVGAYDVVKRVLETEGDVNFWRIRMRPGKPLTFGQYSGTPFLGLPGNPVSAMVSFERFARPAILKMAGWSNFNRPTVKVRVEDEINSDGRESYLRAVVMRDSSGYYAQTMKLQGSHMITSMVNANSLLIIPEGVTKVLPGTILSAMMIDWPPTVF